MATVSIVLCNDEIFDLMIGLSNKQRPAIMALIERKNEKARELGLDHKWVLDEYDVPDIVEFIENIKRGYVIEHPSLQDEEYEKIVKDMSRGSI